MFPQPMFQPQNQMLGFFPKQNQYANAYSFDTQDEVRTLAPKDQKYYNYLSDTQMFENAEYHSVKPTKSNY
jgi:hypothetical protein